MLSDPRLFENGQDGDKPAHGVADKEDGLVAEDFLVDVIDMFDHGIDVVGYEINITLRSRPIAPAVAQMVVSDDGDVEVFNEEGGQVLIVTGGRCIYDVCSGRNGGPQKSRCS